MGKRYDTSITGIIHCRIASVLLISYVIIIHLFLILAISHSDILGVVKQKLGYLPAEISDFYKKSVGHHLRVDAQISPGAVIFLGDSIVQGLCVPCVSKQAYNFGIGGDTTVGVLQRLKYYQSVQQAGTVVLSVGTNDLARRSSNEILSNYNKILASIPASVKIVLVAIFPVNTDGSTVRSRSNDQIRSINTQLAQLGSPRERKVQLSHPPLGQGGQQNVLTETARIARTHRYSFSSAMAVASLTYPPSLTLEKGEC